MPFSLSSIPQQAYQSVSNLSASAYQLARNGVSRQNPGSNPIRALERVLEHDIYLMDRPVQVAQRPALGNSQALQMESYLSELESNPVLMNLYRMNNVLNSLNPFRGKSQPVVVKVPLLEAYKAASKETQSLVPFASLNFAKPEVRKAAARKTEDAISVALAHPDKSKSDQAWKDVNYLLQAGVDPNPAIVSFALKRKEATKDGRWGSLKIDNPGVMSKAWTAIEDNIQYLFGKP